MGGGRLRKFSTHAHSRGGLLFCVYVAKKSWEQSRESSRAGEKKEGMFCCHLQYLLRPPTADACGLLYRGDAFLISTCLYL